MEKYDKIILSPGPGIPEEAGLLLDVIHTYKGKKPILGVCLGEQAIGQAFGGKLSNLSDVFHGVQTTVKIKEGNGKFKDISRESKENSIAEDYIFRDLPEKIPDELGVTAISPEGQIMALKHRKYDIHGIQFHPESVLTPDGKKIMENWLNHS